MPDDLLRSNLSAPPVPLLTKEPAVSTGKTTRALGQLAELGAAGTQLYTKEHEAKMTRQAMNDLVNDAVSPDLQMHEAAYAQTIAKGNAMRGYTSVKERIQNGEFDEMSPEDFQKNMRDLHGSYKDSIAKSKFSDLEAAEYDKFWLENEATVTAGQAGMHRKHLEVSQGRAMIGAMSVAAKQPGVTAEQILRVGADERFTMVDEENFITAALIAGVDSGNISVLEDLNSKLYFSNDPKRASMYQTALAGMEKLGRAANNATRAEAYNELKRKQSTGELTLDVFYKDVLNNPELKGPDGKDIVTYKEFVNMMWSGNVARDNQKLQNTVNLAAENGTLDPSTSPGAVNKAYEYLHGKYNQEGMTVTQKAAKMGGIAKASHVVMPHYKNLAKMWSNSDPLHKDGSTNQNWMNGMNTLRTFKDTAGDTTFWKHMDEESAAAFRIASNAEKYGSKDQSDTERYNQAAVQVDKMRKARESDTRLNIPLNDKDIKDTVTDIVDNIYGDLGYFPIFGKDEGSEEFDEGLKTVLAQQAADLLNNGLATKDTLEEALTQYVNNRVTVIGGNLQDTKGKDVTKLVGGDPDRVLNSYAYAYDIDIDPDNNRVILNMDNHMLYIRNLKDTTKDDRKIPLSVLHRYSLGQSLSTQFNGKDISYGEVGTKYDRFTELSNMHLTPTSARVGGAGPKIIDPDQPDNEKLYNERRELRSYLHQLDELNERYLDAYLSNTEQPFDYDSDKVTLKQWGLMTPKQKTETRMNSISEWTNGNKTIQKALDNISADRTYNFPLL